MDYFFLAFYHFVVFIRPQEFQFLPLLYNTRLMFYTLILCIVAWFFSGSKHKFPPQTPLLILLLVIIIISAALNGWAGGGLTIFAPAYAKTAVIPFLLFATIVTTRARQKTLMFMSVVSALVMLSNGFDQVANDGIGWSGTTFARGTERITYLGIFEDPNDLGMFFVMVLPLVVYYFARGGIIIKLLAVTIVGFLVQGMLLTDSRGTLLGGLSLCGLWFLQKYSVKTAILTSGFTVPAAMFAMSKFRAIDPNEGSAEGRFDAWFEGFQMLKHNPIFGVGYGQFVEEHGLTAHNSYVLAFSELGLTGYFLWLSFLVLTFMMLYSVITYKHTFFNRKELTISIKENTSIISEIDDEILIARVLFFSMVGYAVTAFFLSRTYIFPPYIFAGMSVACYYRAMKLMPDLKPVTFQDNVSFLFRMLVYSIVFIYVLTRVMLHWS